MDIFKAIHYLEKQSTTKCGYFLYTGGVIVENTTRNKSKVTCKHCLSKIYEKMDKIL